MIRRGIFAALFLIAATTAARADYAAGVQAWGHGDFAAAAAAFLPSAQAGDAEAQYMMGRLYALGAGVKQDFAQAWLWHDRAARQGHAAAAQARDDLGLVLTPTQQARLRASQTIASQAVAVQVPVVRPTIATEGVPAHMVLVPRNGVVESPQRVHLAARAATEEGRLLAESEPEVLVRMVQRALGEAGYNPGTADGTLGPATRGAIRSLQSAHGMAPTGNLSYGLLERLGLADQQQASR